MSAAYTIHCPNALAYPTAHVSRGACTLPLQRAHATVTAVITYRPHLEVLHLPPQRRNLRPQPGVLPLSDELSESPRPLGNLVRAVATTTLVFLAFFCGAPFLRLRRLFFLVSLLLLVRRRRRGGLLRAIVIAPCFVIFFKRQKATSQ